MFRENQVQLYNSFARDFPPFHLFREACVNSAEAGAQHIWIKRDGKDLLIIDDGCGVEDISVIENLARSGDGKATAGMQTDGNFGIGIKLSVWRFLFHLEDEHGIEVDYLNAASLYSISKAGIVSTDDSQDESQFITSATGTVLRIRGGWVFKRDEINRLIQERFTDFPIPIIVDRDISTRTKTGTLKVNFNRPAGQVAIVKLPAVGPGAFARVFMGDSEIGASWPPFGVNVIFGGAGSIADEIYTRPHTNTIRTIASCSSLYRRLIIDIYAGGDYKANTARTGLVHRKNQKEFPHDFAMRELAKKLPEFLRAELMKDVEKDSGRWKDKIGEFYKHFKPMRSGLAVDDGQLSRISSNSSEKPKAKHDEVKERRERKMKGRAYIVNVHPHPHSRKGSPPYEYVASTNAIFFNTHDPRYEYGLSRLIGDGVDPDVAVSCMNEIIKEEMSSAATFSKLSGREIAQPGFDEVGVDGDDLSSCLSISPNLWPVLKGRCTKRKREMELLEGDLSNK